MKRGRMCICVRTRARGKKNKEERKKVVCFAFQEVTMTHTHTEKHGKKHLWLHVLWQQQNSLYPPPSSGPPFTCPICMIKGSYQPKQKPTNLLCFTFNIYLNFSSTEKLCVPPLCQVVAVNLADQKLPEGWLAGWQRKKNAPLQCNFTGTPEWGETGKQIKQQRATSTATVKVAAHFAEKSD